MKNIRDDIVLKIFLFYQYRAPFIIILLNDENQQQQQQKC